MISLYIVLGIFIYLAIGATISGIYKKDIKEDIVGFIVLITLFWGFIGVVCLGVGIFRPFIWLGEYISKVLDKE
jgi:hypothetical protein